MDSRDPFSERIASWWSLGDPAIGSFIARKCFDTCFSPVVGSEKNVDLVAACDAGNINTYLEIGLVRGWEGELYESFSIIVGRM
jgi:hypothetical protein